MVFDGSATVIGIRQIYNPVSIERVDFGIPPEDRLRHLHIIGRTGVGKSTLGKRLFLQDVYRGNGAAFFDPHGKEALELLDYIPPHRMRDVVYFDPTTADYCPGINLLALSDDRDVAIDNVTGVFRYLWPELWGVGRMQYLFKHTVGALLDFPKDPGATLLDANLMYSDKGHRNRIIFHIKDAETQRFWREEYPTFGNDYRTEAFAPIQNKIGQLPISTRVRNVIAQPHSTIDFDEVLARRQILIANLDKNKLGEDNTNFLGAVLFTGFQLAGMKRSEAHPIPYYLYFDEFQSFLTHSSKLVFSEGRKFGLSITAMHQFIQQIHEDIRHAILNNVGTQIAFRLGDDDAETLYRQFGSTVEELTSLGYGEVVAKMLSGGAPETFKGRVAELRPGRPKGTYRNTTHLLNFTRYNNGNRLIAHSRKRYTKSRHEVEAKIKRRQRQRYRMSHRR